MSRPNVWHQSHRAAVIQRMPPRTASSTAARNNQAAALAAALGQVPRYVTTSGRIVAGVPS